MSYAIGTKLSFNCGSECAAVFAEDKVMVTRADGEVMRQVLMLADWLAFAGDQEIVADTSGVAKLAETNKALAIAATYPVRPIGTILRVSSSNHSESAVVTSKGIILLKVKDNDDVTYPKTVFKTEAHWRASLPDNMTVTVTEPKTAIQKRQEENPITSGMSDAEKFVVLKKTYKVGTGCYTLDSNNENLARVRRVARALLNTETRRTFEYYEEQVKYWEEKCSSQTAEQNDFRPIKPYHSGKSAFYLVVGDEVHGVASFGSGEFIVDLKTKQTYKCFADIPGCLNAAGKPKLTVFYRNEYINLADKF